MKWLKLLKPWIITNKKRNTSVNFPHGHQLDWVFALRSMVDFLVNHWCQPTKTDRSKLSTISQPSVGANQYSFFTSSIKLNNRQDIIWLSNRLSHLYIHRKTYCILKSLLLLMCFSCFLTMPERCSSMCMNICGYLYRDYFFGDLQLGHAPFWVISCYLLQ